MMTKTKRTLGILLVTAMAAGIFLPASAWARKKKRKEAGPPPDLQGHVAYLAQKLYGMHLDESGPLTGEIQKLVLDHMQEWFAQHPPSDPPTQIPYHVDVRRELEDVFAKVQYPVYCWPKTFAVPWNNRLLIGAGFTLGWSKSERGNVVALYERADGKTTLKGVTNFVNSVDLNYQFMPSPGGSDFRVLVYGTRLGKSHPRLSAELFSYDGNELKSLWKKEDYYDGKIDFENDRVVISYMKEGEFVQAATYGRTPPRYEVVYQPSAQGLDVVSDHQLSAQGQ